MRFPVGILPLSAFLLAACGPAPQAEVDTTPLNGREIYATRCVSCHQADGGGIPGHCPPMVGSPILAGSSDDLIQLILLGKKGPIARNGVIYNGVMPAWRYDLNDSQIADVVNELYARWQPQRAAISPEAVQNIRQSLVGRQPFSDSLPK